MPRLCFSLLLSLLIASSTLAVTMDWEFVGEPGNGCDPQTSGVLGPRCIGAVEYDYWIGTYEVTNAQYADFLNAKAATDPLALYNSNMSTTYGGITRLGVSGAYTYVPTPGRENMPVVYVTFHNAIRFTNWINNGQGSGDTETGTYTLLGGTPLPSNWTSVTRNPGALIALTSEDEWYKAAYYDPAAAQYFDYPVGTDTQPTCSAPTATPNSANCNMALGNLANVGNYPGSESPYGTFDQGGNAWEYNEETFYDGTGRQVRGGSFSNTPNTLNAAEFYVDNPHNNGGVTGFRLVMIPEPSTGMLVIAGLLGLARWRRARA